MSLIRLSVNITPETADRLQELADARGITKTEALRHAIATAHYFHLEIQDGSDVLVKRGREMYRVINVA